jgi:hypothetical protein
MATEEEAESGFRGDRRYRGNRVRGIGAINVIQSTSFPVLVEVFAGEHLRCGSASRTIRMSHAERA